MDITQLILDDHHEQRRLFALIDEIADDDVDSLKAVWGRLSTFLEVHAKAEEELFYPALLKVGHGEGGKDDAADETIDALEDHNDIRDAVAKAGKCKVGSKPWREAVAEANKANGDHMAEEEREGLTDFRRTATIARRHALGVKFIAYDTRNYAGVKVENVDPEAYVKAKG